MKNSLLFLITMTLSSTYAQTVDSIVIWQVDSLLNLSREFIGKNEFDNALEVITTVEKITLEKIGRISREYGSCRHIRGVINYKKNNLNEAEKCYIDAIAIREKIIGNKHIDYAMSLNNLGILYMDIGKYEKSQKLLLEAKTIRELNFGKENLVYASSLLILGNLYFEMKQYEKAESLYVEVKYIIMKLLGKENSSYAMILNNLANLYSVIHQFEKAEQLQIEAISIREKVLGLEHPEYILSLENLGTLYYDKGDYEKAESIYVEVKSKRMKLIGKEHPDYARILNKLANLYTKKGQFEMAEQLQIEAVSIREKVLGLEHPVYIANLLDLGTLYHDMGYYDKAELLYLKIDSLRDKTFANNSVAYFWSLNNLGNLYSMMGQFEKGIKFHLKAKSYCENIFGHEQLYCASSLHGLATTFHDLGQLDKAEILYLEEKSIREKVTGIEHPDFAWCLHNLANLYFDLGQFDKSERYHLEAKSIREKILGKFHPDYARSLNGLAVLYLNCNQYDNAERLILEALIISEQALGINHPNNLAFLKNISELYIKMRLYSKAEPFIEKWSNLSTQLLTNATHHLSERELNQYLQLFKESQNEILNYTQNCNSNKLIELCYNNTLFYKGFLLTSSNAIKRLASSDSSANRKYNILKSFKKRIIDEYSKPVSKRDTTRIREMEYNANSLEKDLVISLSGYNDATRLVKWEEIQSKLKLGEAALEFVSFKVKFQTKGDSVMYAAILLKPEIKQPIFIPLFDEMLLDSFLLFRKDTKENNLNTIYTMATRGAVPVRASKKSIFINLYELIWKPIEKELFGIKTIYYSPSGLLHRINLDAIPISEAETLADRYKLIELNSTRQLVTLTQIKNINNEAVLYGGINFEQDSTFKINEPLLASRTRGELSISYVDSTLRGGTWNYLAGTEKEVRAIEKIMQISGVQTKLKKGYDATEESFKNIGVNNSPSPRILHIATHGFFFPDPRIKNETFSNSEPVYKISENPMLRSGLIMAGGNAAWKGAPILEGREDGILTAYEISQMNLSNTELVVLSACETGLGDIQGSEGVYGLQRAFKIAGAKYLIMSLWQVPDKQTSLLMTTFYKKWLEEKMTIPDAFHAAQKQLRDNGLDPYNWAGFVLVQ